MQTRNYVPENHRPLSATPPRVAGWLLGILLAPLTLTTLPAPTAWGQAASGFAPAPKILLPNQPVPGGQAPPAAELPAPVEGPGSRLAPAQPAAYVDEELAELTPEERINIAVYEKAHLSVVHIETRTVQSNGFFGAAENEGSGSGSVWDARGHILTNYHVVAGAQQLLVTLHDGQQFEATLVGADPPNDIAVLRIEAPPEALSPVEPGRSERLRVGQRVFALGSPLGLEQTMTVGIVSSLNRTLPSQGHRLMKSIIQIDAPLNRGNSGGPLLDSRGRLIGMNTAIASRVGESSGIGFAIPSATISRIVPQLIRFGRINRPSIGIEAVAEVEQGLLIVETVPEGPAEKAGLQGVRVVRRRTVFGDILRRDYSTADIMTHVDGVPVNTVDDLLSAVESKQAGDVVRVTVERSDQTSAIIPVRLTSDRRSGE
ncbi:S1C family serine protease [Candidatus Laterigemmans baculatus]|uniref:S1C family serine protease n=1 Tax=Candidatus Laterigemmans baculatus TaxID=2770505 RepID=UPI0013D9E6EB|nr:trypsin-like peptidase domain-containing protein [Candidatus Laterigemmans baculatus]